MADILITPATGIVEFKDNGGVVDATIQLDGSGNLNITHPGGNLNLGNPGTPVYIGDGVNTVDVIFEQSGAIRALSGKTLTIGQADSNVVLSGNITSPNTLTSAGFIGPLTGNATTATNVAYSGLTGIVPTWNQNTTGTASNVTGTVAIANGGTGATTAATARTNLGATTLGGNLYTLTNVAAISFPRFNADNTISSLDAASFRTAIGAGTSSTTGTVTSVGGTGTVAGLTLTGTVTSTGNLTLGGTLSTPISSINDSTTVGQNLVKLTNPNAVTFLRFNADNTATALDAASFRTAIGAGTSSTTGTVTSISTGTGLTGGPITSSGTIALADTAVTAGSYTLSNITVDAQGRITAASSGTVGESALTISNQIAAYTVVAGDLGKIINCTSGTFTVSLTAAATLGSGFNVTIWNTGSGTITIDPSGTETIDGKGLAVLKTGEGMQVVCNGTNWETGAKKLMRGYAESFNASDLRPSITSANSSNLAIGANATISGIASIAVAIGYNTTVSGGTCGTAIGANSSLQGSVVTASGAMALGGSYASGTDSFAAAVTNNTSTYGATGANSVAIGRLAKASGQYSFVGGGSLNQSTGLYTFSLGLDNIADTDISAAILNGGRSRQNAKLVVGNKYSTSGDNQWGLMSMKGITTTTIPLLMNAFEEGVPNSTNIQGLQFSQAMAFSAVFVAKTSGSGTNLVKAWKIEGLCKRGSTGTASFVGNPIITIIASDTGTSAWLLEATIVPGTNAAHGFSFTATGAAATNIRWNGSIQTTELIY